MNFSYLLGWVHFSAVFTALSIRAALLFLDLLGPDEPPPYAKPESSAKVRYFEWLENNTHLIYPILAVAVVALIAFGIIGAWRSEDIDGLAKAELKREIIRQLRREVYGLTAVRLATILEVPGGKMLKLLEEMAEEGMVESRTDTSRVTTWRMKGLTDR